MTETPFDEFSPSFDWDAARLAGAEALFQKINANTKNALTALTAMERSYHEARALAVEGADLLKLLGKPLDKDMSPPEATELSEPEVPRKPRAAGHYQIIHTMARLRQEASACASEPERAAPDP